MKITRAQNLVCPLDSEALIAQNGDRQLVCAKGHSFDVARQGYVNLLPVQDKRSKNPGDSKEMIDARTRLLNSGAYEAISDLSNSVILDRLSANPAEHCTILDAGCGEGYYVERLSKAARQADSAGVGTLSLIGMDISKPAIIAACKRNKRDITWLVGTNRKPPVLAGAIDAILCMFGYPVYDVFKSALKPAGVIILVEAGPRHLIELRELIYTDVKMSSPPNLDSAQQAGFELVDEYKLEAKTGALSNAQIQDLFLMTPHYFRSTPEQQTIVARAGGLDMSIDVAIRVLAIKV
jgi:23S rRNA (guanine745-N1)-methyltransferase